MAETLICIELPGQVERALKAAYGLGESRYSMLALTPHVEYALERLGQDYLRPEDYHSEDDCHAVGLSDLSTLEQFCQVVDGFLQDRWGLLREHDLRPARLDWYYLKTLFNSVSVRAFILRRVLEAERPQQVLLFGTQPEPPATDLFFVRESAWASVIPLVARALGIEVQALGRDTDPSVLNRGPVGRRSNLSTRVKDVGRRFLGPAGRRLVRDGYTWARLVAGQLRASSHTSGPAPDATILALENSYSLGHLLQHIEARNSFQVLHWDAGGQPPPSVRYSADHRNGHGRSGLPVAPSLKEQGARLWEAARELPKLLHFSGIDCFPALESRLRHFFETDTPEMVRVYLEARSLLQARRPVAVLAATMGDYRRQAVALAARKEGVPFVVYRHGSSGGYVMMESWLNHNTEHLELEAAEYVLVPGEGDVAYLGKHGGAGAQLVPVGSAALDRLKKPRTAAARETLLRRYGLRPEKRTVMYVPTSMDGNIRAAPYRSRSPSRMFRLEQRIVEVFSEFPETQFVLKLPASPYHPCSPVAQLVRDRHLKNCVVITDPLPTVLPMADMFVTDYPSTSFLEMLTTDRPILVCGYQLPWPWAPGRWHPSALEMWQERVAYAEGLEEFLELLRTYLREERFQPVQSSNTLLKLFGTHLDDGQSVERAHAFLESLARQPAVEGRQATAGMQVPGWTRPEEARK